MKLYHHKTDGGAEYLMDTYNEYEHDGKTHREGVINEDTKYVVRIDGDITKDAEISVRDTGFIREVINHFKEMPVLTEAEQALLDKAKAIYETI